jgi:hypothetical protein
VPTAEQEARLKVLYSAHISRRTMGSGTMPGPSLPLCEVRGVDVRAERYRYRSQLRQALVMAPKLSVGTCPVNGAAGVGRCLRVHEVQGIRPALALIVEDDDSTEPTRHVARAHGAAVIPRSTKCGLSAPRNSGISVPSRPVAAFLDDDSELSPRWAEALLTSHGADAIGLTSADDNETRRRHRRSQRE